MVKMIDDEPLARYQYVSIANVRTLAELDTVEKEVLFSMAVYISNTRLIDNFLLRDGEWMIGERIA
jgi:pantoate--beta-alanine ligase